MLFKRWNKNGDIVNCEASQLEDIAKNGYTLEECPVVEPTKEVKNIKKPIKKKKDEKIILETEEPVLDTKPKSKVDIIL